MQLKDRINMWMNLKVHCEPSAKEERVQNGTNANRNCVQIKWDKWNISGLKLTLLFEGGIKENS